MGRPRCVNHGCELDLSPDQLTATSGKAPCPVSGAIFDFTQQVYVVDGETKKDKFGNIMKEWSVTGDGEDSVSG